jgi:hypothetical protein
VVEKVDGHLGLLLRGCRILGLAAPGIEPAGVLDDVRGL